MRKLAGYDRHGWCRRNWRCRACAGRAAPAWRVLHAPTQPVARPSGRPWMHRAICWPRLNWSFSHWAPQPMRCWSTAWVRRPPGRCSPFAARSAGMCTPRPAHRPCRPFPSTAMATWCLPCRCPAMQPGQAGSWIDLRARPDRAAAQPRRPGRGPCSQWRQAGAVAATCLPGPARLLRRATARHLGRRARGLARPAARGRTGVRSGSWPVGADGHGLARAHAVAAVRRAAGSTPARRTAALDARLAAALASERLGRRR